MWVEYGSTMTARMRLRAKNAHVFGADAPLGVVDKALAEEVEAVRAGSCEQVAQRGLRELSHRDVVRKLRVSLVAQVSAWTWRAFRDHASAVAVCGHLQANLPRLACPMHGRSS